MYIKVYTFGKQNKSSLKDLQAKYLILLSKWNVDLIFLKESKIGEVSDKQKADFETLQKFIDPNYTPVLMDERGDFFTSLQFSNFLEDSAVNSQKLAFCLGGPFGFREEDKTFFKYKLGNKFSDKLLIEIISYKYPLYHLHLRICFPHLVAI